MLVKKETMTNKKQPMLVKKEFIAFRQFSATFPAPFVSTFNFAPLQCKPTKIKRASKAPRGFRADTRATLEVPSINARVLAAYNSTFASWLTRTNRLQPHRKSANRYGQC